MGTRTGTYYTGTWDGTAGSGRAMFRTVLVTGEGWFEDYTGTNTAVFRQAGGNGFSFVCIDDASLAAGGREMRIRGCESATAVTTLIDAFPSTALVSDANCVWRKSATADSTARNWWAVADDKYIIIVAQIDTNVFDTYIFGDIEPYWVGDNYATVLNTRGSGNVNTAGLAMGGIVTTLTASVTSNFWFSRTASGTTKIDRGAIIGANTTFGSLGGTGSSYPHPETNKLHQGIVVLRSNGSTTTGIGTSLQKRGTLPYLMEFLHSTSITSLVPQDTYTDSAYDASSEFIIFAGNSATVLTGAGDRYILQTAGTWNPGY